MSTDMEAQVRGIRDRQGFVLPHFYAEAHASAELVHRLKRASENIGRGTLRGRVLDSERAPRAGVTVWAFDAAGRIVGGVATVKK